MVVVRSLSAGVAVLMPLSLLAFFGPAVLGQTTEPASPGNIVTFTGPSELVVYHLKYVDATQTAGVLSEVFNGPGGASKSGPGKIAAVADARTNSVILASDAEHIAAPRRLLEELDRALISVDHSGSRKVDDEEARLRKMETELQTLLNEVKALRAHIEASTKPDQRQSAAEPKPGPDAGKAGAGEPSRIDAWVAAALDKASDKDAWSRRWSDAEKRTLLRRVFLDLTGTPPTSEQLESYLGKDTPDEQKK